jgi:hypothetical protein
VQISRKLKLALAVTLGFMIFEFVGGYITGRCAHDKRQQLDGTECSPTWASVNVRNPCCVMALGTLIHSLTLTHLGDMHV